MANNNIKLKRKKITGTSVRNKLKVLSVLMVVGIFVLTAFVTVYDHPTLGSSGVVTPSASSGNHVTITVWGSGSP